MIFIALRVFLSTKREKLVRVPDLVEKERRRFLTIVLDRGCVVVQLKDDGRSVRINKLGYYAKPKTSKMRANKQNTLLSQHVTNQINFVHTYACTEDEHILVLTARGELLMQYS